MSAGRVGQLGSGVEVAEVQRMRNKFVETQIQKETQTLGIGKPNSVTFGR